MLYALNLSATRIGHVENCLLSFKKDSNTVWLILGFFKLWGEEVRGKLFVDNELRPGPYMSRPNPPIEVPILKEPQ